LTFPQFVSAVMGRNGLKIFTTGANQGPNAYTTLAGVQVAFQVNQGVILNSPNQGLVSGNFVFSDVPGRIVIRNSRIGEELTLDDTNPAAPVRTFRAGLPKTVFNPNERERR
jgi:hypothetical protein